MRILALLALILFFPFATHAETQTCATEGGTCTTGSCGEGFTAVPINGLCPEDPMAVCCKAKESCESQGGVCKTTCAVGDSGVPLLACPSGQHCCQENTGAKQQIEANIQKQNQKAATTFSGLVPSCGVTGDCTVDDIVKTGVNFATFLLGLSGALFFLIFIYGGARYLLSFGNKSSVEKGTSAIKGAAIGIVIVMGAWTIVRYITSTIAPGLATPAEKPSEVRPK